MRLVLRPNKQNELIDLAKTNSELTWIEMSKRLGLNECYIRTSLKSGKCAISMETFNVLCNLAKVNKDEWMKFVDDVRNDNWGQIKGGKIGGKVHKPAVIVNIKEPILSKELAEFIGILLGDGSLSNGQYDCSIVLNKTYDAPYIKYVSDLIFRLFNVNCHLYNLKSDGVRMTIYSKRLFEFLVNKMHISYGGQCKFIPSYLTKDKMLARSVLRGIFDTDGSVYLSSKRKIINIKSRCLKEDVKNLLDTLKIRYHISGDNINITNHSDVKEFLSSVGSSNLKNIIKVVEFYRNKNSVKSDAYLLSKFDDYSIIKLPFTYTFK